MYQKLISVFLLVALIGGTILRLAPPAMAQGPIDIESLTVLNPNPEFSTSADGLIPDGYDQLNFLDCSGEDNWSSNGQGGGSLKGGHCFDHIVTADLLRVPGTLNSVGLGVHWDANQYINPIQIKIQLATATNSQSVDLYTINITGLDPHEVTVAVPQAIAFMNAHPEGVRLVIRTTIKGSANPGWILDHVRLHVDFTPAESVPVRLELARWPDNLIVGSLGGEDLFFNNPLSPGETECRTAQASYCLVSWPIGLPITGRIEGGSQFEDGSFETRPLILDDANATLRVYALAKGTIFNIPNPPPGTKRVYLPLIRKTDSPICIPGLCITTFDDLLKATDLGKIEIYLLEGENEIQPQETLSPTITAEVGALSPRIQAGVVLPVLPGRAVYNPPGNLVGVFIAISFVRLEGKNPHFLNLGGVWNITEIYSLVSFADGPLAITHDRQMFADHGVPCGFDEAGGIKKCLYIKHSIDPPGRKVEMTEEATQRLLGYPPKKWNISRQTFQVGEQVLVGIIAIASGVYGAWSIGVINFGPGYAPIIIIIGEDGPVMEYVGDNIPTATGGGD